MLLGLFLPFVVNVVVGFSSARRGAASTKHVEPAKATRSSFWFSLAGAVAAKRTESKRAQQREQSKRRIYKRAHPDLNQGPADLQSAALTTELCTHCGHFPSCRRCIKTRVHAELLAILGFGVIRFTFFNCIAFSRFGAV